jgi:hypothetical protein
VIRWAVIAVVGILAALGAGCGAGRDFGYDCSNGQADGYGGCIPNWHAPPKVEAEATRRFAGKQVDRVACYNVGEAESGGREVRLWLCKRVGDGRMTSDAVCIAAANGRPLSRKVRATSGLDPLRCPS